ncbi:trypsin-like peptidase domain-containing protein [Aquimarina algiphila]|uniref:trypsin-like peptidase domain-containing protein n=1 Tax=Aquimarina algiphila TaxID=2047982 RepID=UPI00232E07C9|nr:trypsin-like peptidase domain-containing protein [Aquimarina algiphila]
MSISKKIQDSIYRINTSQGTGTGFYNTEHNIIITNYHVIEGNTLVSIEDQEKNRYLANVMYINSGKDLAFLKPKDLPTPINTVTASQNNETFTGDKVLVLGYPYGMPFTVTEGIVSNPHQIMNGSNFIQTDAAVNPGNSGGPIINSAGDLVGVVTSKFTNADNMGFAIPMGTLHEELSIVPELQSNTLTMACHSCNGLIAEKTNYCPNCGTDINEKMFDDTPLSEFSVKVEQAIAKLGISPVLARSGNEYWTFHQGSALIKVYVCESNYLFASSALNDLPRTNLDKLYQYILTEDTGVYQLSISQNKIYLSYRIHISDLYTENELEILENLARLAKKADELDDVFVNNFGAKMTHLSKVI